MASPSRPGVSGRCSTPQAVARSTRAEASATGRPPGSRLGRQPVSTAPRSPARRGTQASRAPVVAGQPDAAAKRTGHGGQPLADEDARRRCRAPSVAVVVPAPSSAAASLARARSGSACRPSCAGRARCTARSSRSRVPARCGLAQPQEDRAGLVLGLQADQHDGAGALSRSAYVDVAWPQHDLGGQELGLLGGVRPGAEVDVVGAEGDPGELGVRVGVLGGQPAAGQRPPAAPARRPGRGRRRRTPRATLAGRSSPVVVADHRVGQPVGLAWRRRTRSGPCR